MGKIIQIKLSLMLDKAFHNKNYVITSNRKKEKKVF